MGKGGYKDKQKIYICRYRGGEETFWVVKLSQCLKGGCTFHTNENMQITEGSGNVVTDLTPKG